MQSMLLKLLASMTALLVSACAAPGGSPKAPGPAGLEMKIGTADVWLLGEMHDDPNHQRWHRESVEALVARGQLAALALEMAERGATTAGLPAGAQEAAVREALRWNDPAWPWGVYGPAIMAAVRAGVPVLGTNLPRAQLRQAMADASLDQRLPAADLARQQQAVRDGHCGLLPADQVAQMTRVQIARDMAMAEVVAGAARPGGAVVLLAGSGHVDPQVGVPRHLPDSLRVRALAWPVTVAPAKDYCAQLREQWQPRPPPARRP